jgi:glycosyltransferase involved in cell wall biosynthesis
MRPWVVVAGDFARTGGMDRANHALADWLARSGRETHLVAHRVEPELAAHPGVRVHAVPRPFGAHALGFPLLDRAGARVAARLAGRRPVVLGNGGNTRAARVVWLHYVHAAYVAPLAGSPARRMAARLLRRGAVRDERRAAGRAALMVANSRLTARHAVGVLGVPEARVRVAYYGADAGFRPPSAEERAEARRALGWPEDAAVVLFVGALGDRRKGFDTLLAAWRALAAEGGWEARLAVAGTGHELEAWRRRVADAGLGPRVELLGFRRDLPRLLRAADLLAAPTRYEAYGLAVQEALCCGLPAVVSAEAGVAERIPPALAPLLLPDPDDPAALAERLRRWRDGRAGYAAAARALAEVLAARSWDDMAAEICAAAEEAA